jgi:UDP-N-acetylmuramoyl-L-alanyl-D-glutamate--2,6-diaminopimelate ligase
MDLSPFIADRTLIPLGEKAPSPTSFALDSRKVEQGGLFIAIPGNQHDGSIFIEEALRRGAVGIITSQGLGTQLAIHFKEQYPDVSFFETQNVRKAASLLAACFYPLQPDNIIAVTGTNGKTSVVSFIRQLWGYAGIPAASLGTLGLVIEGTPLPSPTGTEGLNTPDPLKLHQILQGLKEQGIDHLAFEASSHGIHQHRLDSVRLKASVFTNFSNDHLDYHSTLKDYYEAKLRLFQEIMPPHAYAVLNADIAEYEGLLALCTTRGLPTITYGKQGNFVQIQSIRPTAESQELLVCVAGQSYSLTLPLVGQFQVYNAMAALSAVIACGGSIPLAIEACRSLKGVPGRLEQAAPGIYVDYAHTPDGLSVALKALRAHTQGQLWVVFGCGGNRDPFKRPLMGKIAATLADKAIVTDDNPRHENPADIRYQILAQCPEATEIPCRREAIQLALTRRKEGDVVLIAGKGHETYQLVGDQALSFNDVEEVQQWGTL